MSRSNEGERSQRAGAGADLALQEAIRSVARDPAKASVEKVLRRLLNSGRVFAYSRNVFNSDDYKFTLVAKRRQ